PRGRLRARHHPRLAAPAAPDRGRRGGDAPDARGPVGAARAGAPPPGRWAGGAGRRERRGGGSAADEEAAGPVADVGAVAQVVDLHLRVVAAVGVDVREAGAHAGAGGAGGAGEAAPGDEVAVAVVDA